MKYFITTSLSLACLILLSTSCANDGSKVQSFDTAITKITGKIANPTKPTITLNRGGVPQEQKLGASRDFTFTFNSDKAEILTLQHGYTNFQVYIEPGKTATINLDSKRSLNGFSFEADHIKENEYLNQKSLLFKEQVSEQTNMLKGTAENFQTSYGSYTARFHELFNTYNAEASNPNFVALERANLAYELNALKAVFPQYFSYYNPGQELNLPDDYYAFTDEMNLDNPDHLNLSSYKNFLNQYIAGQANNLMTSNPDLLQEDASELKAKFQVIKKIVSNPSVQSFLMYGALNDNIRYKGINGMEGPISDFNKIATDQNMKNNINGQFNQWAPLAKGKPAPGWTYRDISGKEVSLNDFKGKYVYVDVWATWCGPCKREIPALEELQHQYQGSDKLVFTSVSIDKDKKAWERMVKDKSMKGVQLIADSDWSSSITRDYRITGIPRFLLIGPDGNIVNVNAPRPSSKEIGPLIKRLVQS